MCTSKSAAVLVTESGVLDLVETRIGEPLRMHDVRETIDHLAGLGRFEDIRVFATAAEQGVTLRWLLVPVTRINKITVTGASRIVAERGSRRPEGTIRRAAVEQPRPANRGAPDRAVRGARFRARVDPAEDRGRRGAPGGVGADPDHRRRRAYRRRRRSTSPDRRSSPKPRSSASWG